MQTRLPTSLSAMEWCTLERRWLKVFHTQEDGSLQMAPSLYSGYSVGLGFLLELLYYGICMHYIHSNQYVYPGVKEARFNLRSTQAKHPPPHSSFHCERINNYKCLMVPPILPGKLDFSNFQKFPVAKFQPDIEPWGREKPKNHEIIIQDGCSAHRAGWKL